MLNINQNINQNRRLHFESNRIFKNLTSSVWKSSASVIQESLSEKRRLQMIQKCRIVTVSGKMSRRKLLLGKT